MGRGQGARAEHLTTGGSVAEETRAIPAGFPVADLDHTRRGRRRGDRSWDRWPDRRCGRDFVLDLADRDGLELSSGLGWLLDLSSGKQRSLSRMAGIRDSWDGER
jgi:hypothetical protein